MQRDKQEQCGHSFRCRILLWQALNPHRLHPSQSAPKRAFLWRTAAPSLPYPGSPWNPHNPAGTKAAPPLDSSAPAEASLPLGLCGSRQARGDWP